MNEKEKEQLKTALIEAGWWHVNQPGDPTTNDADANALLKTMQDSLALGCEFYVCSPGGSGRNVTQHVTISGKGGNFSLGTGSTLAEAICVAALALSEKLRLNPSLAAGATVPS